MRSTAEPEPRTLKARLHWLREDRDHKLAVLAEMFIPRLRALHDEHARARARVWEEYDRRVRQLREAA